MNPRLLNKKYDNRFKITIIKVESVFWNDVEKLLFGIVEFIHSTDEKTVAPDGETTTLFPENHFNIDAPGCDLEIPEKYTREKSLQGCRQPSCTTE